MEKLILGERVEMILKRYGCEEWWKKNFFKKMVGGEKIFNFFKKMKK